MAIKPSKPVLTQAAPRPDKSATPATRNAAATKTAPAIRSALDQATGASSKPVKAHQSKLFGPSLFVGIPEVAHRLGLGETTVWIKLIRDGGLPVVRIGRRTLVSVEALEAFAVSLTSSTK